MRSIALIVGLTAFAVGSNGFAMPNPGERVIAEGKIVNVDEKNLTFGVLDANGRQSSHRVHSPICITMRFDDALPYDGTWDDLRQIGASGRVVSVAVDPSNPNVVYIGGSRRY